MNLSGFKIILSAVLLTMILSTAAADVPAETRAALVIGNGNYRGSFQFGNTLNDARDVAELLLTIGFTVELLTDAGLHEMEQAVVRLGSRLSSSPESVGVFFYAGHWVQSGAGNFLIPADAEIVGEVFLKQKALAVQAVLDTFKGAGNKLNLAVLDAYRDYPRPWVRSGSRGLTVTEALPPGSIIAYATSPGSTARQGSGRNGVFTGELLRHLATPGLDISDVLRRTGASVREATGGAQIPTVYSQYYDRYSFTGAETAAMASPAIVIPSGAAPRFTASATLPESIVPSSVTSSSPADFRRMVRIEGGTFTMGDTSTARTSGKDFPRQVTVNGFFMGSCEVTFEEYDAFCEDTGRNSPGDQGWGRGLRPVINVGWNDAVEYCNWMSMKEGLAPAYSGTGNDLVCDFEAGGYRLPTEAEWEFAAKGGRLSRGHPYSGSGDADEVGWHGGNSGGKTRPVGGKRANELGLFDMSGNVWEWCWDRYEKSGPAGSTDSVLPALEVFRAARGGSWIHEEVSLRTEHRIGGRPEFQIYDLGFRLVRPGP